jgi:hypothetical protein
MPWEFLHLFEMSQFLLSWIYGLFFLDFWMSPSVWQRTEYTGFLGARLLRLS